MEKPEKTLRKPARGTKIEWATHTVNWLAGCTKISPACTNCYAEVMTARLATMPNAPARYREGVVSDRRWTGRVTYDSDALRAAFDGLRDATSPRRVFCNSMSDTFHADAPPESLRHLADRIMHHEKLRHANGLADRPLMRCDGHVIMLLTKRPDRLLAWQREHFPDGLPSWVWVGCTVEDQRRADDRIPYLLQVDTAVRFLSCEPLLGPVDLDKLACRYRSSEAIGVRIGGRHEWPGIQWVIVGGESGPGARPMHPEWARSLRDQCVAAGVPFHFKQWGEYGVTDRPLHDASFVAYTDGKPEPFDCGSLNTDRPHMFMSRIGKHAAGRLLDGRTWDEFPGEVRGA